MMRAAVQSTSAGAVPSASADKKYLSRRPAMAIAPKCALAAPDSTSAIARRQCLRQPGRRWRRRRRRGSSTSSVVSAPASSSTNNSAANNGDDELYLTTKEASSAIPESLSFQRTPGEVASSSSSSDREAGNLDQEDPFMPGDLVEGRYRVEAVLGRGAMGVTFAVRDEQAEGEGKEGKEGEKPLQLALKATRLRGRGAGGWKAFDLAEREAAALKSLSGHPNIPRFERFFDVDRTDDRIRCLVEERVKSGKSLAAVVASGERASPEQIALLARDILSALSHLSSRSPPVTHRDVKPENIVLEGGKWGGKAFLVDFSGVAAAALAESESGGGGGGASSSSSSLPIPSSNSLPGPGTTVIGTFGFMAPEQFRGAASPASDVYALGATLLFALTGRQPSSFPLRKGLRLDTGTALQSARAPRLLREIVEASLEPSPEDRPTADDALRALEEAMGLVVVGGTGEEEEEEEEEGVVFSGRAFGGKSAKSGGGGGGAGAVDRLERAFSPSSSSSSPSTSDPSSTSNSSVALFSSSSSFSPSSSVSLMTPPAGARSKIGTRGKSFALDVPAGPLLAPERAGSAAFAVVWTASVAAWTFTALAAGSLFAAAFSIPFWLSGAAVAKDALGGALSGDSRLEIGPRTWRLVKGRRGGKKGGSMQNDNDDDVYDLSGALEEEDDESNEDSKGNAVGGETSTLRGARVSVTAYVNGVPRTRLEIVDGFNLHVISEDLSLQEQRWLARAINAAVERATGKKPPLAEKKKKKRTKRSSRDDESDDSEDEDDDLTPRLPPRVFVSDTTWGPSGFGVGGMWGDFGSEDRFIGGNGGGAGQRGFFGDRTDGFADDDF